jgi:hypothetical protein
MAVAMIQRTEFPLEKRSNARYKRSSPRERYEQLLRQLDSDADRRFVVREAAYLSEYGDKSSWYLGRGPSVTLTAVRGLTHEFRQDGLAALETIKKLNTPNFLRTIGQSTTFQVDRELANKLGLGEIQFLDLNAALKRMPPSYSVNLALNRGFFETLQVSLDRNEPMGRSLALARAEAHRVRASLQVQTRTTRTASAVRTVRGK